MSSNFRVIGKCKCGYYLLRNEEDGRTFCPICSRTKIGLESLLKNKDILKSFINFFENKSDIFIDRFSRFLVRAVKNTNDPSALALLIKNIKDFYLTRSVKTLVDIFAEKLTEMAKKGMMKKVLDVLLIPENELNPMTISFLKKIKNITFSMLSQDDETFKKLIHELKARKLLKVTLTTHEDVLRKFAEKHPEEALEIVEELAKDPYRKPRNVELLGKIIYHTRKERLLEDGENYIYDFYMRDSRFLELVLRGVAIEDSLFLLDLAERHEDILITIANSDVSSWIKVPDDERGKLNFFKKLLKLQKKLRTKNPYKSLFVMFERLCAEDPSFSTYYQEFCITDGHIQQFLERLSRKDALLTFQLLNDIIDEKSSWKRLKILTETLCNISHTYPSQAIETAKKLLAKINKKEKQENIIKNLYPETYSPTAISHVIYNIIKALLKTDLPEAYKLIWYTHVLRKGIIGLLCTKRIYAPEYAPNAWYYISGDDILHKNFIKFLKMYASLFQEKKIKETLQRVWRVSPFFREYIIFNYLPYLNTVQFPVEVSEENAKELLRERKLSSFIEHYREWLKTLKENNFGGVNAQKIDTILSGFFEEIQKYLITHKNKSLENFICESANYLCDVLRNLGASQYVKSIKNLVKLYILATKRKIKENFMDFIGFLVKLSPEKILTESLQLVLSQGSNSREFVEMVAKYRPKVIFSLNDTLFHNVLNYARETIIRANPLETYEKIKSKMSIEKAISEILKFLPEKKSSKNETLWSREEFISKLKKEEKKIAKRINVPYRPKRLREFLEDNGFNFFEAFRIEEMLKNKIGNNFSLSYNTMYGLHFSLAGKIVTLEVSKKPLLSLSLRSFYNSKKYRENFHLRKFLEGCKPLIESLVKLFGSKNIFIDLETSSHGKTKIILRVNNKPVAFCITES